MIRSFMFVFVTLLGASVALTIIVLLVLELKPWGEIVRHCENNNFILFKSILVSIYKFLSFDRGEATQAFSAWVSFIVFFKV